MKLNLKRKERYNPDSVSNNNNRIINISRCINSHANRAKWNINTSTKFKNNK